MAAIDAGCLLYFGYPITPQNDIPEFLSKHLPALGGEFIQAESEIASINLLLGASATGTRAMTSSSSPGISLMQEGISYMGGSELPAVIVNISRSGPGLGGISPSQGDYFQATRGGGHGDYRVIVLAPSTVQEMYDLTFLAFDLADKYRNPAMILGDALIGQMKEPLLRKKPPKNESPAKDLGPDRSRGKKTESPEIPLPSGRRPFRAQLETLPQIRTDEEGRGPFRELLGGGCPTGHCRLWKHCPDFKNLRRTGSRRRDEGGSSEADHPVPLSRNRPFSSSPKNQKHS